MIAVLEKKRSMPEKTVKRAEYMIPMLVCRDGAAEIEFCRHAFGAVELSRRTDDGGAVTHATLAIGSTLVMIHGEVKQLRSRSPEPDGSSPVVVYAYVQEEVDAVVARAVSAGARIETPVTDLPWGDRMGRIVDPAGHVWNVANRAAEGTPKETDAG